ncbi:MAG: 2-amino-4-hydroxy-6-hydroxymethyldihydropteridine diphosphokinase, partial [Pseudomonadota bacterium]
MWEFELNANDQTDYVIALGSNLGDRRQNLETALSRLEDHPLIQLVQASHIYETPPWGDLNQGAFYNACVRINTRLSPDALLEFCLATELSMGRMRDKKWGPRLVDLDIVWWSGGKVETDHLTIPHPFARIRAFVLVPLSELGDDIKINHCTAIVLLETLEEAECSKV